MASRWLLNMYIHNLYSLLVGKRGRGCGHDPLQSVVHVRTTIIIVSFIVHNETPVSSFYIPSYFKANLIGDKCMMSVDKV